MPFRRTALPPSVAALLLAACAHRTTPSAPARLVDIQPMAACAGQRYVDVRNDTTAPVSVFAVPVGQERPALLGAVPPGGGRLRFGGPVYRAYAEQGGRKLSAGRGRVQRVSFRYRCERR